MKLIILGGSSAQLIGIDKAKQMGAEVILCDYLEDAKGHGYADKSYLVSTFDYEGVLEVAKANNVDGIMTLGTDQPVLTATMVAENMNIPSMINEDTALKVTNKIAMKQTFLEHQIPTVDFLIYEKGVNANELVQLDYPVVIKPVDSQGQRGIFYLNSDREVIEHYEKTIKYSRDNKILVEKYYEHDEITVSGWVVDGVTYVLSITDRVTFEEKKRLGICLSHEFPSKHLGEFGGELIDITKRIVKGFNISNGPIYFQFLIGNEGIKVNEIACRIGGAYEATFLPEVTGFDICDAHIKKSLGLEIDTTVLDKYDVKKIDSYLSVQLFFATECDIHYMPSIDEIKSIEGVMDAGLNFSVGEKIETIEDATARVGYVIVEAESKVQLEERLKTLYEVLVIEDIEGVNHIVHRKIED